MLFTPTALILADNAQQNLLNSARLSGQAAVPAGRSASRLGSGE